MHELITSRKNPFVMRMAKLSEKKYRDAEGLFRIDGVKLFTEAFDSGLVIEAVFLAASRKERLTDELGLRLAAIPDAVFEVSDEVLSKLTDETAPQGIVTVIKKFDTLPADIPASDDFRALYLSQIRDPGNLGTMIRTACAFGVDRVYVSADCADIYSPKTVRAAMGTIFRQKLSVVRDETAFIEKMKAAGCEVCAAALKEDAVMLGSFPMPKRVCFAVGNEGHGLSEAVIDACSRTVLIPMEPGCESLNAASAAAVLIWEMCRGRLIQ